ncbi:class I SAM-dependent methyltransferase [Gemmata sp.]|uniref:class I SAM-dependent methyltransferase n=1 Tax=Gemmata sp. TaxID=1914242 RepID=UPI003F6FF887
MDVADQAEAAEWARRFGVADRVAFVRGDAADACGRLTGAFDVAFIDTLHDAASVERDVAAALRVLRPGGVLAFHDYPDPAWPDVRRVVDAHARGLGWRRVAQAGFVGVFQTRRPAPARDADPPALR